MGRLSLKQKPVRLLIIITLAVIISSPIIFPHQAAAETTQYYNRTFAWDYNGDHWVWNLSISVALYEAYKAVPDSTRIRNGPAGYDLMTTTKDQFLQALAEKLNETANQQDYGSSDKINFVLAFVQSIPYSLDLNTTGYEEYPRFPIEVLVDQTGDCDCKAILFGTLALLMGYEAVYINPTDHFAVGVAGNDFSGTYWTYNNTTYYYAETTGTGFKVGQLPDEFQGKSAYVYGIDENNQFVPNVDVISTVEPSPTPTNAQNVTNSPTPTFVPNPTDSGSINITQPTIQPVEPLSVNLISDNPLLFIVIAFAITASIILAVWSVRRPKEKPIHSQAPASQLPSSPQEENTDLEGNKFCIYCGSSNKTFAAYCKKCGKNIG